MQILPIVICVLFMLAIAEMIWGIVVVQRDKIQEENKELYNSSIGIITVASITLVLACSACVAYIRANEACDL